IEFNWTTASETNNDYFVIEMSKDMINFEQVVKIKGAGTSNSINQYQELIETKQDYNYFRLVQVDFDGKTTIYPPIVIDCDSEQESEPELIVYPNPFNNDFYVELNNFNEKNATIQIIDELGKIVYQESISNLNNNNVFNINPSNLKPSMYQLRVVSDENIMNQKIIKK
ncbi:MAG: T9SS type A sorting domain-containing protein, partial [Bacteroidales bacterium]|nr:T9SS type A sorting domain-containing protein [Bacteroidales bacterium]